MELLRWRDVETLMTDILARHVIRSELVTENVGAYPYEHSPQISVRHPCNMLYSYLTEPERPRIYISYPISRPRRIVAKTGSTDPITEINHFRDVFNQAFTAFDPITIDERPLKHLAKAHREKLDTEIIGVVKSRLSRKGVLSSTRQLSRVVKDVCRRVEKICANYHISDEQALVLRASDWWPIKPETILCGAAPTDLELVGGEVEEVTAEIKEGVSEIDLHIRARDYRLIDQSDYVVIYRPTYPEKGEVDWTTGTSMEFLYAQQSRSALNGMSKQIFIIRDAENDGEVVGPPFFLVPNRMVFEGKNLHVAEHREEVFNRVIAAINKQKVELAEWPYRPLPQDK